IIDGGSTDESVAIIKKYETKITYWVSEKDNGIYDAINKGIRVATGNYIVFLNSGDYFLSADIIEYAVEIISKESLDIYYGNVVMEPGNKEKYVQKYPAVLNLNFWQRRTINHQASFIKSSLFLELGLYESKYTMAADYAFFLKAYIRGKQYFYMDRELVHYPLDGFSSKNLDKYILQMKGAWKNIVPQYVQLLHKENNEYKLLMKHIIMGKAKSINKIFQKVICLFR
ncbi:glycosyltransferase family 2 protein, partial [Ferruginibacter sp.]|uniref:glycosyltransferase family 2 protein n=1 Tax=Ferruginibacter sp. TaxID=1940288 RepID=UPI001991B6C9